MVVRYTKLDEFSSNPWIRGCADWMWEHVNNGWMPYYINIVFQPLPGNAQAVVDQMKRAICKGFYSRLCTEFAHHPTKPSQQKRLPMLGLFPDRHVPKLEKVSVREMQFNDNGVHYNGPMMIPPVSRFKGCPIQHIHDNQRKYAVRGIDRIHVKEATWDLDRLADYAGKTIKSNRANPDDIIILPESFKKAAVGALGVGDRAVKEIQSQHNFSDEIARQMLMTRGDGCTQ